MNSIANYFKTSGWEANRHFLIDEGYAKKFAKAAIPWNFFNLAVNGYHTREIITFLVENPIYPELKLRGVTHEILRITILQKTSHFIKLRDALEIIHSRNLWDTFLRPSANTSLLAIMENFSMRVINGESIDDLFPDHSEETHNDRTEPDEYTLGEQTASDTPSRHTNQEAIIATFRTTLMKTLKEKRPYRDQIQNLNPDDVSSHAIDLSLHLLHQAGESKNPEELRQDLEQFSESIGCSPEQMHEVLSHAFITFFSDLFGDKSPTTKY